MVDTYVYYKTKKVILKDVIDDLQDTINVFYKKQKINTFKKENLRKTSWVLDMVSYYANFNDEKTTNLYLVPGNQFLRRKTI